MFLRQGYKTCKFSLKNERFFTKISGTDKKPERKKGKLKHCYYPLFIVWALFRSIAAATPMFDDSNLDLYIAVFNIITHECIKCFVAIILYVFLIMIDKLSLTVYEWYFHYFTTDSIFIYIKVILLFSFAGQFWYLSLYFSFSLISFWFLWAMIFVVQLR